MAKLQFYAYGLVLQQHPKAVARVALLGLTAAVALAGATAVENSKPVRCVSRLPLGGDVKPPTVGEAGTAAKTWGRIVLRAEICTEYYSNTKISACMHSRILHYGTAPNTAGNQNTTKNAISYTRKKKTPRNASLAQQ